MSGTSSTSDTESCRRLLELSADDTRGNNDRKYSTLPRSAKMNLLSSPSFLGRQKKLKGPETVTGELVPLASTTDEEKENHERRDSNIRNLGKGTTTTVTIVLVEAKGLPDPPADGSSHGIYCKFGLGNETFKSKIVPNTRHPKWRQRFQLHFQKSSLLQISLWDKGKQKNFMGSCTLELADLELERTHELWLQLDDGFGSVHFALTMCIVGKAPATPNVINRCLDDTKSDYTWYNIQNLKSDWNSVGQLHVTVHGAKGLGRCNAHCILELDNERVQTHSAGSSPEPMWNKDYVFNVRDVTSTLDIKVYDNSLVNIITDAFLGRISIPLCKIRSNEMRWFALKDKSKRYSAKGNCPRILLELTMDWNPVKATARMFRPKEVKYIKKPKKFDIGLVYTNVEFVRDVFHLLVDVNEGFKRLFEWENREFSCVALICWVLFWFFFEIWMLPLLLLIPFFYFGLFHTSYDDTFESGQPSEQSDNDQQNDKNDKTLKGRMMELPEMTLTITDGIEYMASVSERFHNLVTFRVPFLTNLTILLLLGSSVVLHVVPFNYLLIAFGIYKFTRKYLHPERKLNNDIIDFINHLPDNDLLKDWKELRVPEPAQRTPLTKLSKPVATRSHSSRS